MTTRQGHRAGAGGNDLNCWPARAAQAQGAWFTTAIVVGVCNALLRATDRQSQTARVADCSLSQHRRANAAAILADNELTTNRHHCLH